MDKSLEGRLRQHPSSLQWALPTSFFSKFFTRARLEAGAMDVALVELLLSEKGYHFSPDHP